MPRGRPPRPDPTVRVHINLSLVTYAKLGILLGVEGEQRIPYGALTGFFEARAVEWLDAQGRIEEERHI